MATDSEHWASKVGDLIAKLLVPGAIAWFGYKQSATIHDVQKAQTERALDQTLAAVVYRTLIEGDADQRTSALSFVEIFSPELRKLLANAVVRDPGQPPEIAQRAERLLSETLATVPDTGALAGYKIDIYYDHSSERDRRLAERIKDLLEQSGIYRTVILAPRTAAFVDRVGRPFGYEVRYEPGVEDGEAMRLRDMLNAANLGVKFQLRTVVNRTSKLLSVFVFSSALERPAR
jgi:hypothetical protein